MTDSPLVRRLGQFIDFERRIRMACDLSALDSVACNAVSDVISTGTVLRLVPAPLYGRLKRRRSLTVRAVAGVSSFDDDAPLICKIEQFAAELAVQNIDRPCDVVACTVYGTTQQEAPQVNHSTNHDVPETDTQGDKASRNSPVHATAMDLLSSLEFDSMMVLTVERFGYLILLRNGTFRDSEQRIGEEVAAVVAHAERVFSKTPTSNTTGKPGSLHFPHWLKTVALAFASVALLSIPLRESVMADAEVVAAQPIVVAASLDGVVRSVEVRPNERVKRGQLLVSLDDTEMLHRQARLQAELSLLHEQRREASQSNLQRGTHGSRLAELDSQIDLKTLDLDFLQEQIKTLSIYAEADGIALYTRQADWLGRSVRTGERIMEIAVDAQREFEAWVAVNDAITLERGASVKFFPDAFPLDAAHGEVDTVSFFATRDNNDRLAYRVVASMGTDDELRLGMKGVVRLYGERVPLAYALLRKPAAATRRALGL